MIPPPSPKLTLAMIVRNEEKHIRKCLQSAAGLVDEMIVVDTGSTDQTISIAKECGAHVIEFPWIDDFSASRNRALDAARGKWILVLDADEFLPESSVSAIRQITSSDSPLCAYNLLNRSTRDNGRTGLDGLIVRLFRNDPRIRYEWPVHEQVVTSLQRANVPIVSTKIEILHTGYSSPEVNAAKQRRNLRILETMTASSRDAHPMVFFLKGGAFLDLGRTEEALETYTQCLAMTPPGDAVHEGALVRSATCLSHLKKFQEIRTLVCQIPLPEWHPELLLLKGQAELALGDFESGWNFLQGVFEAPAMPRIPAYDPVKTSIRTVMVIASFWEKVAPARAVALLRLANQSLQTGVRISLEQVLAIGDS
jgi:hypothetical protein